MSTTSPPPPRRCAILPFTPIIGVLIFDGKWGPELHYHHPRWLHAAGGDPRVPARFQHQKRLCGLEVAYRGMADAFAGVVMLLVAAGVFAQGLSTIGFINGLISIATFGSASIILMLVLVILTMLAAMTTGSGNAPFYAFVEMIPSWRTPPASIRPTCRFRCCRLQPRPHDIARLGWWSPLPGWRRFPHSKWSSAPQCRCSWPAGGDRCY